MEENKIMKILLPSGGTMVKKLIQGITKDVCMELKEFEKKTTTPTKTRITNPLHKKKTKIKLKSIT